MGPEKQGCVQKDLWPFRTSFLPSLASQAGPCSLTNTAVFLLSRCTRRAGRRPLGSQAEDPPPPLPRGRHSACLHHAPPLPSPLRGKEAAGAGVAAGASCPCDRAEPGIRGHVGKTLVPAALPARNAPPAPQPPPAWPRNGDSPAPCSCSHPLIVHPPQPTAGPAAGFPASLPLLQLVLLPALPAFQAPPASYCWARSHLLGRPQTPSPGLSLLSSLALETSFLGT